MSRSNDPAPRVQRPPLGIGGQTRRLAAAATLVAALALAGGCRQDMHQAPRYDPLEASDFFADGRASRPIVQGTIPRGFLREDAVYYTGKQGAAFVTDVPVAITRDLLKRGQDRYDIYCSPCHGVTGDGNGMIVQRGFKQPTSYHSDRLRAQPAGYIYDVITNGFGAMQDYSAQVAPNDRWAVVAYVRTLQFSRHVKATDLPAADRERLEGKAPEGGQIHD
jgi:mono/diheme cytochrome c family protein